MSWWFFFFLIQLEIWNYVWPYVDINYLQFRNSSWFCIFVCLYSLEFNSLIALLIKTSLIHENARYLTQYWYVHFASIQMEKVAFILPICTQVNVFIYLFLYVNWLNIIIFLLSLLFVFIKCTILPCILKRIIHIFKDEYFWAGLI